MRYSSVIVVLITLFAVMEFSLKGTSPMAHNMLDAEMRQRGMTRNGKDIVPIEQAEQPKKKRGTGADSKKEGNKYLENPKSCEIKGGNKNQQKYKSIEIKGGNTNQAKPRSIEINGGNENKEEPESTETDDPLRVFCDPSRQLWYDKEGISTVPIGNNMNALVVGGELKPKEDNTLTICLHRTQVIYADYIRLINMKLPETLQGKCFIGCLLYEYNIVKGDNFQPKFYISSYYINKMRSVFGGIINKVGRRFLFSGDQEIYAGIDTKKCTNLATDIGIDCLRVMEGRIIEKNKKPEPKPDPTESTEKCGLMHETMECAVTHEKFKELQKLLLMINKRKLSYKKENFRTKKSTSGPNKGEFFQNYDEYCASDLP